MKAAQFYGTKNVQINQIPSPVSRRGMVTIDVAWCGTCGSDLHEYLEGPIFIPAVGHPHLATHEQIPVTVRHKFPGTVSAEGEGVTDLAVGDHVVVEPYFVCGVCAPCKQRRYNLCTSAGFYRTCWRRRWAERGGGRLSALGAPPSAIFPSTKGSSHRTAFNCLSRLPAQWSKGR